MDVFGWILTGFTAMVTALIGWQIYTVIFLEKRIQMVIRRSLSRELPKVKGEAIGTALFNIAEHALRNDDLGYALTSHIKAADNLKSTGAFIEEIELCLDRIEGILANMEQNKKALLMSQGMVIDYYNILYNINPRSEKLADLLLRQMRVDPTFQG